MSKRFTFISVLSALFLLLLVVIILYIMQFKNVMQEHVPAFQKEITSTQADKYPDFEKEMHEEVHHNKMVGLRFKKSQLNLLNRTANALKPLDIKTYDGSGQLTHPDVVYIEDGFKGYKYWMAFTPYPHSNDDYENPSVAASNDGVNWAIPTGLKNPIVPPPDDLKKGGHYSDTDIVFDNGKLVVYYVYNKVGIEGPSRFYATSSTNGVDWSQPELIYKCDYTIAGYSPAIIKENDGYKMWYITSSYVMVYSTSSDGRNWSKPVICSTYIGEYHPWHIDIIKSDKGFEGLTSGYNYQTKSKSLFYIKSSDGINWTGSYYPIIHPSADGWDSTEIYRSSFIKQKNTYKVWYSALGKGKTWHVGYSQGEDIELLKGYLK